ncbi:MAG: hypothetical protein WD512_06545, partial [Candidatus Paceibacterota bacterium]
MITINLGGITMISTKGIKKSLTRSERELKSNMERSRRVTLENEIDIRILIMLYLHKCLEVDQIHRLLPPTIDEKIKDPMTGKTIDRISRVVVIKQKPLINKLRLMKKRGIIKDIISIEKGVEVIDKRQFVLTELGLSILLEFFEISNHKEIKSGENIYHFTMDNFNIRKKSQKEHNYSIQEWVTRITSELIQLGIHLPSCEWRRYFNGNPKEGNISYRPDWLFFKPNKYFDGISYYQSNLTWAENLKRQKTNPFMYPIKTRDKYLKLISDFKNDNYIE